jgi:hypothetical protein
MKLATHEHFPTKPDEEGSSGKQCLTPVQKLGSQLDALIDPVAEKVRFLGCWNVSLATTIAVVLRQ